MTTQDNLYIVLEIDPLIIDPQTIKQHIQVKKRQWSRDQTMGNHQARRKAASKMDKLAIWERNGDLLEFLDNETVRREQSAEAQKKIKNQKAAQNKKLQEHIANLRTANSCTQTQLSRLERIFKGVFSRQEIEHQLRALKIPIEGIEDKCKSKKPPRKYLDETIRKKIWVDKKAAGVKSLYTLLNVELRSAPEDIYRKASSKNAELVQKKATDPKSVAETALTGYAMMVFKNRDLKEQYDNSLAVQEMELLKTNIELVADQGYIEPAAMRQLIKQAGVLGVSKDLAQEYINNLANLRNWKILEDKQSVLANILQCGFCGHIAGDDNQKYCANCSEPLKISCPKCKTIQANANRVCVKCALSLEALGFVTTLMRAGEDYEKQGKFQDALDSFQSGLKRWNDWDPLLQAEKRVKAKMVSIESRLSDIRKESMDKKCYVAALEALGKISDLSDFTTYRSMLSEAKNEIEKAEKAFIEGRRAMDRSDNVAAFRCLKEALHTCADHREAKNLFQRLPAPNPENLNVVIRTGQADLSWKISQFEEDIQFIVIRKEGSFPLNIDDGIKVAEVPVTSFSDTGIECGRAVYYGVAAKVLSQISKLTLSGPHIVLRAISNLKADAGDGQVTLSWTSPPNCIDVEVWRSIENETTMRGKGQRISSSGNNAHDIGLQNNFLHTYGVYAVFRNPSSDSAVLYSSPETISVTPISPPQMVTDLLLERQGETFHLAWTKPEGARVQIHMKSNEPRFTPGTAISIDQASGLGVPITLATPSSAQIKLTQSGKIYFTPISIVHETATVGSPASIVNLLPVDQLVAVGTRNDVNLTWKWPKGAKEAVLAVSPHAYPEKVDGEDVEQHFVSRHREIVDGHFTYRKDGNKILFFSVFTSLPGEGQFSKPVHAVRESGGQYRVLYHITTKKNGFFQRKVTDALLVLQSELGLPLSNLTLRGKTTNLPLGPADGIELMRIPEIIFQQGRSEIPIPKEIMGRKLYVKLFFDFPSEAEKIRLMPAARENMKLF